MTSYHYYFRHIHYSQTIIREGDGLDQLKKEHGCSVEGDWVYIHYKGTVAATGKEFEDTYHREKPVSFQIGASKDAAASILAEHRWTIGLDGAARTMVLGEKCRLAIKSDYAYGSQGKKSAYGKVSPNQDVVLICELMRVNTCRRKAPKDDSCCLLQVLYNMLRAY